MTNETLEKSFKERFQGVVTNKELQKTVLDIILKLSKTMEWDWNRYLNTSTVIAFTDRKV